MTISVNSDIVIDVIRAADPVARREAIHRLNAAASTPSRFDEAIQTNKIVATTNAPRNDGSSLNVSLDSQLPGPVHSSMSASQKFEAFVLQTFVQEMLPKDSDAIFGAGTAGDIWKSLLAEQLANELAKAGGNGIAERISKARPSPDTQPRFDSTTPAVSGVAEVDS